MQIDSGCRKSVESADPVRGLRIYFAPQPRIEPISMQPASGRLLTPVQKLVSSAIYLSR